MTDALNLVFAETPLNPLEVALNEALAPPADMGMFEALLLGDNLFAVPTPGSFGSDPAAGSRMIQASESPRSSAPTRSSSPSRDTTCSTCFRTPSS
jgi:hypothetical protein